MRNSYIAPGYQMIRTVTIENFRGIQHAELNDAKRINILVGPNGTGKTAFLEAVFLAAGASPELLIRTRGWRGRETKLEGDLDSVRNALWADTFRDPNQGRAYIELDNDERHKRSVLIEQESIQQFIDSSGKPLSNEVGISFIYNSPEFGEHKITPTVTPDGQISVGRVPTSFTSNFIPARSNVSEVESARLYSRLRVEGNEKQFEDSIKKEFQQLIKDLSVEAPFGTASIWAELVNGRKLPLTMISGGINQLAGMLLRLASNPGGVLIIDEIENGFYHSRYRAIWRMLFDLANSESINGQIFASTHSLECLQALREELKGSADEVRFVRTRLKEKEVTMEQLSGETLFGALDIGEVR